MLFHATWVILAPTCFAGDRCEHLKVFGDVRELRCDRKASKMSNVDQIFWSTPQCTMLTRSRSERWVCQHAVLIVTLHRRTLLGNVVMHECAYTLCKNGPLNRLNMMFKRWRLVGLCLRLSQCFYLNICLICITYTQLPLQQQLRTIHSYPQANYSLFNQLITSPHFLQSLCNKRSSMKMPRTKSPTINILK